MKKQTAKLRQTILTMIKNAGSGHPGGSLSCIDLLATLYFKHLDIAKIKAQAEDRDLVILSKGHAAPALYAILYELGLVSDEDINNFRQVGGKLQGHPDMKKAKGVDFSTGSLGQGAAASVGLAIGAKIKGNGQKVYCLIGDGELQEGLCWEAFMAAAHYKLDNLIYVIDHNGLQIDGTNEEVMSLGKLEDKLQSFGLHTVTLRDGHDYQAILEAYQTKHEGQPLCILAETIKGKGVSFMENQVGWHGKAPNEAEYRQAISELKALETVIDSNSRSAVKLK